MINNNLDIEAGEGVFDEIEAVAFELAPATDFEEDVGEFIRPYSLDETEVDEVSTGTTESCATLSSKKAGLTSEIRNLTAKIEAFEEDKEELDVYENDFGELNICSDCKICFCKGAYGDAKDCIEVETAEAEEVLAEVKAELKEVETAEAELYLENDQILCSNGEISVTAQAVQDFLEVTDQWEEKLDIWFDYSPISESFLDNQEVYEEISWL
jgi:hypothetical protein